MSDIIRRGSKAIYHIIQSAEERKWIYGTVGTLLNGVPTFDVRGRAGYIYVTIRQSNGAQTWPPARNDANVPHALGLPVRMYLEGTTYVIDGINRRNDLASGTPGSEDIHTHDNRYFTETEHISTSAGAGDAGKPIVLDAGGHVDVTMLNGADIATKIHAATLDTTPLDADEVPSLDSSASFALIRTTWTNIKAFLKTYFDTLYVALTGAQTITGTKTFGDGTGSSEIAIDGATSTQRALAYKTAGSNRFRFIVSSSAESGGNAGSNFEINRFDDSGVNMSVPLRIIRSNGYVGLGPAPTPAAPAHIFQETLGQPVLRIESDATASNVVEFCFQNRVATTNATVTTLHTFTVSASVVFAIHAVVIARRTGGAAGAAEDSARYKLDAVYKNVAGTAVLIGAINVIADEDQAGWNATLTISGGTVLLEVTGAASNNITWHMSARVWTLST